MAIRRVISRGSVKRKMHEPIFIFHFHELDVTGPLPDYVHIQHIVRIVDFPTELPTTGCILIAERDLQLSARALCKQTPHCRLMIFDGETELNNHLALALDIRHAYHRKARLHLHNPYPQTNSPSAPQPAPAASAWNNKQISHAGRLKPPGLKRFWELRVVHLEPDDLPKSTTTLMREVIAQHATEIAEYYPLSKGAVKIALRARIETLKTKSAKPRR